MSYIGIGSPIPDISSLPGQTGGEIEVNLNYAVSAICNDGVDQTPTVKTPNGGTFSATPSGLSINNSSGIVDVSASDPGAYNITYTVSGVASSFALTINAVEQSTFSYSSSSLEQYGTASPIFASGTTTGGTFSAPSELVINEDTGVLDLESSEIGGPYTVTYTTPGTCSTSSTFNVSITALSTSLVNNNFALSFNGNDEYVSVGNPTELKITGDITISAWFKSTSTSFGNIVSKGYYTNGGTISYQLYLRSSGGGVGFDYYGGNTVSTRVFAMYTTAQNDGQWHHLVGVKSGSGSILYLDGSQVATGSGQAAIYDSSQDIRIGNASNNTLYFDGDIDEVAIWSRALELSDIQRIYNGTNSNPGKAANLFSTGLSQNLVYWNRMGDN